MTNQSVNVRLTKEANRILAQWKKRYGGRNKSETIKNVDLIFIRASHLGTPGINQEWPCDDPNCWTNKIKHRSNE